MLLISKCSSRGSIDTDEYRDDYDDESTDKSGSGFMNTFRTAVQRAYDAVGDPEKEGVNQDDITDILSKLGYSSEDRETQNILSQAAVMTTNNQNMKFQEVFKLVVGRNEEETLADITNAFEIFDRDDDGKLQTKDLHRWVTIVTIVTIVNIVTTGGFIINLQRPSQMSKTAVPHVL